MKKTISIQSMIDGSINGVNQLVVAQLEVETSHEWIPLNLGVTIKDNVLPHGISHFFYASDVGHVNAPVGQQFHLLYKRLERWRKVLKRVSAGRDAQKAAQKELAVEEAQDNPSNLSAPALRITRR
jgi:hypothetical protein